MPSNHQWIFDVLKDLRLYALANGLPALARKTEEAIETARAEIEARAREAAPETGSDDAAGEPGGERAPGHRRKMH